MRGVVSSVSAAANLKSDRFYTLDGMRGVAAIIVALFHIGQYGSKLVPFGYLAVDFFFALSGFVIIKTYAARFEAGLTAWRFMTLRVIRLYPLYLLGLGIGLVWFFWGHRHSDYPLNPWWIGRSLLMLPTFDFDNGLVFPFNGPAWSLSCEMGINVVFAVWLVRLRHLILLPIAGGSMLLMILTNPGEFEGGWSIWNYYSGITRAVFGFSIGMIIHQFLPIAQRRTSWLSLSPIIAMSLIMCFGFPSNLDVHVWQTLVVILLFPALLSIGILFEAKRPLKSIFNFLGDISYALYAIHWPLIPIFFGIATTFHLTKNQASALTFIGIFSLATIAAKCFDQPVRTWLITSHTRNRSPTKIPASTPFNAD